ncbi:tetratricopeptide repeat protein [Pseudodesulfovibrio sp. zrk46]|uniref:tetratricopeptide repeat protein n=1 Tax=Pseudodesulfovibrio sp. zrk46 TaxID=2725288 RepID=UPI001449D5C5|nr:tetratricopeptide repeat protein [Pseudodesulfovibrio sp. zrk46]QJB58014.1 tetratricopeptide repeat protein [Pseudodesulfovibrio sp. zrk46]
MPSIANLINELPEISQSRLVASGYGVWVTWKGKVHNSVVNTLREYGCLKITEELDQALWFCNSTEVFRALARLQIWARVNPMPVLVQVVPMTFLVGYDMEYSVSISPELDRQDSRYPQDFEVFIHPKLKDQVKALAGLDVQNVGSVEGLAGVEWLGLQADQGLDYETIRKWFFVIKPLGRMADKEAILGWRDFSTDILDLLQKLGLKYISDVKEGAIFFPLDNFQLLRSFCHEILTLIRQIKEDPEKKYWPVVMAAISQENLQFSPDLPKKIGLDWNRLAPDFPHVRFMDGFLLSEWFRMNEASYGTDAVSLDSWCNLALKEGGAQLGSGTMQVALPSVLIGKEGEGCFYCGQTSHVSKDCPSKMLPKPMASIWNQLANTNIKDFTKGFMEMEKNLSAEDYANSMLAVFDSKNELESILARAVYEINASCQIRMLKIVWRSRSKEWGDALSQLAPEEGEYVWDALSLIEGGDYDAAEKVIKDAQLKYPRSYQPHSLWGFWNLEIGDYTQALFHWQESERMSYTPMQQGYFAYLQARLLEVDGNLKDAINTYKHANSYSPTWIDPVYRQGVCMVKMGFTGQAMDLYSDLIDRDPNVFNRILIDPELDRGRVQLMTALYDRWAESEEEAQKTKQSVEQLLEDISKRFDVSHSYYEPSVDELERLKALGTRQNYVAYQLLIRGTEKFKSSLDNEVKREIKRIEANLEYQTERVRTIQREAAWFPFPKLLLEFNKDFNFCVDKINWIRTQRLKDADNFRKSLKILDEIEDRIDTLQGRLVTLRIVRDSTLFVLMLGRNFIWLELIGLGLALVAIPSTLYFTQNVHNNWIIDSIREQRWEFTKGLVIILSIVCLALAAIKSAFSFDKRKRELFEQLDEELRESAPRRY